MQFLKKKKYHINWKFHSMKHQKYHLNWTQIHLVYDRRRKYILKVSSIIEYIKTHLWWNRFNVFSDANPQKLILTTQTILKRNYSLYFDKNKFIMNSIIRSFFRYLDLYTNSAIEYFDLIISPINYLFIWTKT